jgi:hypothetical protein
MVRGRLVESWVQVDGLPGMKCRLAANSLEDESVFRGDGDGTRAPTRNVLLVYHLGW